MVDCCTSADAEKTCEVASFKNFENISTSVKVTTKTKVAPFYLGHGVDVTTIADLPQKNRETLAQASYHLSAISD